MFRAAKTAECCSLTVHALVQQVFPGGEAFRTGLVQLGDVLVEVDGHPVKGRQFMEVMDSVVATKVRDAAVPQNHCIKLVCMLFHVRI